MCGIAGAYGVDDASSVVSIMLKDLQHRGQDAAGMASFDGGLHVVKGLGLADTVFNHLNLETRLPGRSAVGHLRYPTSGNPSSSVSIQPLTAKLRHGREIALAHNGNLTNHVPLRESMQERGSIIRSDSDSEMFLHLTARSLAMTLPAQLRESFGSVEGAYALLALTNDAMYAAVDPQGFRPLVVAPYKGGWLFASETRAFDRFDVRGVPIENGELHEFSAAGTRKWIFGERDMTRHCSFEHIYFASPDSEVFGRRVYDVRKRLGRLLGQKMTIPTEARENAIVIAVPDSSNVEAIAFAQELGLNVEQGLIRSHYIGRTFIGKDQKSRKQGVSMKFNFVRAAIEGRRVYVIDDSLVRGNTAQKIVKLLRQGGATEVHMGIASPPVKHPCHWGIDTPERKHLIAAESSIEQIKEAIGVDSLTYLSIEELRKALEDVDGASYCTTCFTTERPISGQLLPSEHLVRHVSH